MRSRIYRRLIGVLISCGLYLFGGTVPAQAARVDTVLTFSVAMEKEIPALVILPDIYEWRDSLPVVYMLHGHGGNYTNWLTHSPELPQLVDRYGLILVCADGGNDSWYWDSPLDPSYRYETYIARELPEWIDAHYKTAKSRESRAITGLSMGGYGALYLAIRHQDRFGAAGSTAGGVDFRPFPMNWNIAGRLGSFSDQAQRWDERTVANMVHLLRPGALSLILDCGVDDFFWEVNESLHRELSLRGIPHTYMTGPGGHDWSYWRRSIGMQLQYFYYFFYGGDEPH